ncbi:hypothetical protein IPA_01120 [Ignicoccus pacificus DSM 13166]|uniref:Uncharacterized protein n=1 Tax=Ignicoccus pacificus DSM 13166 TaxID=940294 RepID=A0A977KAF7_9CREN|nr:hypothetical protein IPA_01120 [Ignicoccus pacificus DSM 13166]
MRNSLILLLIPIAFAASWHVQMNDVPLDILFTKDKILVVGLKGSIVVLDYKGNVLYKTFLKEEVRDADIYGKTFALLTQDKVVFLTLSGKKVMDFPINSNFAGSLKLVLPYLIAADKYIGLFYLDVLNGELRLVWGLRGLTQVLPNSLIYFEDDGGKVLVADAPGRVYLLRADGEVLGKVDFKGPVYSIDYCGGKLAVGGDGFVKVIELKKPQLLLNRNISGIALVSFEDGCERLAVAVTSGKVLVFEGKRVTLNVTVTRPTALNWERGLLIVGSRDGTVTAFKVREEAKLPKIG